jgi:hypothetical protein
MLKENIEKRVLLAFFYRLTNALRTLFKEKCIFISWKCRRLDNPGAVLNLKYHIRKYKPDVMVLYETLTNSNKTNELRFVLDFDSFLLLIVMEGTVVWLFIGIIIVTATSSNQYPL